MKTSEKVAYLKGLADGVGLDKECKQDKLIAAIIDVLDTISKDIEELDENTLDLSDEIDAISEDLADIESIVYGEYDDECCCDEYDDECCCGGHDDDCCCDESDYDDDCCCGHSHHHHHEEHTCCCGHHHDDTVFYEVTCPACENTITIDEEVLSLGKIECPNCGETLEFDLDDIDSEETDKE